MREGEREEEREGERERVNGQVGMWRPEINIGHFLQLLLYLTLFAKRSLTAPRAH